MQILLSQNNLTELLAYLLERKRKRKRKPKYSVPRQEVRER